jgi:hypothetical protein
VHLTATVHRATSPDDGGATVSVTIEPRLAEIGGDADGVATTLKRFEAIRKPRTTMIQEISAANTWGRYGADTSWLYGYDAWTVPLTAPN